jgi:hypothetical protein
MSVLGVLGSIATVSGATGTGFFGGGDAGVFQASDSGNAVVGGDAATRGGITIRVTGFTADDTRTVVGLSIEGRDDIGDGVLPLGQAQLVDQDGRIYREMGGSADSMNHRLISRYYPPLDSKSRTLNLQVSGLEFIHGGKASPLERVSTVVDAQWSLQITPARDAPARSLDVAADHSAQRLGSGYIVIDRVRQAISGTVVNAHLEGFGFAEVPELGLEAALVDAAGNRIPVIGLHMGYGASRELVELRFPRTSGDVGLRINGTVDSNAHDLVAAAKLSAAFSDTRPIEWPLSLPR